MKFYKMHGTGNDYIYFDCMHGGIENAGALARRLCDRHFSVGGDGIILLCPSKIADCAMRMFNADGSEGKMCGNGIRCLGKLAHDLGYAAKNVCTVETLSGVKSLSFRFSPDGKVSAASVDMGAPVLEGGKIPSSFKGDKILSSPLEINGKTYNVSLVSMGNPHCVVFTDDINSLDLPSIGPGFEKCPAFPEGVNTEFVRVSGRSCLEMRVWERGSGETLACGTGACAAVVAATLNGFCTRGEEITVRLRGGELKVRWGESVIMTGAATLAFTGEVDI